jgi:glycosyltransferase involved in cell wall biosynthesis
MTDAISMNYARVRGNAPRTSVRGAIYSLEAHRLLAYERAMLRSFPFVSLVSAVDRAFLLGSDADAYGRHVVVCPNGVDTRALPFSPAPCGSTVAFIGNIMSLQNLDACLYFARHVMPLLSEYGVTFRVIGRIRSRDARALRAHPHVEVTGEVSSVPEAAAGAIAGVCPVRIGAGVQNKILEYMSLGIPAITSSVGLEGLDARPGVEVLRADTPGEFAEHIVSLMRDSHQRLSLAVAARRYVETRHDWAAVLRPFVERARALVAPAV